MALEIRLLWSGILFVFGLMVGSFLNVCIYRLPRGKSLTNPSRSYCPTCRTTIAWYDNIPLLSYLWLGRLCRHCGSPISPRYFMVEFLTGLTMVAFFNMLQVRGETPGVIFLYTATACVLIVASFIDLDLRIIPDEITIGGMLFAPAFCLFVSTVHDRPELGRALVFFKSDPFWGSLASSLTGMATGALIVFAGGVAGKVLFRKESMGLGDIKFMAFLGAVLGWKLILLVFFLSTIPGGLFGIVYLAKTGDHHIPYAPFLSAAAIAVMLAANDILGLFDIEWLLNIQSLA